jgi:hypothetical protein
MLAVYLHDLWLCSLVRSPFRRCEVAFSPSSLKKQAAVYPQHTTAHQGSQYLLQGKRICLLVHSH